MTRGAPSTGRSLGLGALLALLALMVNVLSPPGFMAARRGSVPAIVICTGHGPAAFGGHGDLPADKSGKAGHGSVCPFAGHGLAGAPPPLLALARADFAPVAPPDGAGRDLAPGRGLAAPPPPSHAPPVLV